MVGPRKLTGHLVVHAMDLQNGRRRTWVRLEVMVDKGRLAGERVDVMCFSDAAEQAANLRAGTDVVLTYTLEPTVRRRSQYIATAVDVIAEPSAEGAVARILRSDAKEVLDA